MTEIIQGFLEMIEEFSAPILIIAGILLLLNVISQPTFIDVFVHLFKDATMIAIICKFIPK